MPCALSRRRAAALSNGAMSCTSQSCADSSGVKILSSDMAFNRAAMSSVMTDPCGNQFGLRTYN